MGLDITSLCFTDVRGILVIGGSPNYYSITALPLVAGKTCSRSFLLSPRQMRNHGSALYRGERLLVCGGYSFFITLTTCFSLNIYDLVGVWETVVPLPVGVGGHTMTTIGDTESVAVVGGSTGGFIPGRDLDILSSLL